MNDGKNMSTLLYLHGFLSSPQSFKARQTQAWLSQHQPSCQFLCPFLSPYPEQVLSTLVSTVETLLLEDEPIYVMGSSMGGFWASILVETYNLPAVIINPACYPAQLLPKYLNQTLKNYHTDDIYQLDESHLPLLAEWETKRIQRPQNYWLLLQTGDETLDYREAEHKFGGCRQTVELGGDHSFTGLERFFPKIWDFFLMSRVKPEHSQTWAKRV